MGSDNVGEATLNPKGLKDIVILNHKDEKQPTKPKDKTNRFHQLPEMTATLLAWVSCACTSSANPVLLRWLVGWRANWKRKPMNELARCFQLVKFDSKKKRTNTCEFDVVRCVKCWQLQQSMSLRHSKQELSQSIASFISLCASHCSRIPPAFQLASCRVVCCTQSACWPD